MGMRAAGLVHSLLAVGGGASTNRISHVLPLSPVASGFLGPGVGRGQPWIGEIGDMA